MINLPEEVREANCENCEKNCEDCPVYTNFVAKLEDVKQILSNSIERDKAIIEKFFEDARKNITHALLWMTDDVIKAEKMNEFRQEFLDYLNSSSSDFVDLFDILEREREEKINYVLTIRPWMAHSTSPMANIENEIKAETNILWARELKDISLFF